MCGAAELSLAVVAGADPGTVAFLPADGGGRESAGRVDDVRAGDRRGFAEGFTAASPPPPGPARGGLRAGRDRDGRE